MMKDFKFICESGESVNIQIDSSYLTKVGSLIIEYINSTYEKYGVIYGEKNIMFAIGNRTFNSEYITKFVNNIKMYTNTIKRENIKDGESFFEYIRTHLYDMFHYNGIHFKNNYRTVTNTSNKGHRGEPAGLKYFSEFLNNKCQKEIPIELPNSILTDIGGVDGSFLWNGNILTIQVKPFSSYIIENEQIIIETNGSLKLNANYLVLYKEKMYNKYDIIILSNGKNKDKISYSNSSFYTHSDNFSKLETDVLIEL